MRRQSMTLHILMVFILTLSDLGRNKVKPEEAEWLTTLPTPDTLQRWAHDFGNDLRRTFNHFTQIKEINQNFQEGAKIVKMDGSKIVETMKTHIEQLLSDKMEAVQKLRTVAENEYKNYAAKELEELQYPYFSAKLINEFEDFGEDENGTMRLKPGSMEMYLSESKQFHNIPVNSTYSTIHVPTNVYDRDKDVLNAVEWSNSLDTVFRQNAEDDPTLTWQYFGSATGMFRNYPGIKWMVNPKTGVDLFDCRTRGWYIQAATSPKDLIILIDVSGSMTGERIIIARQTVETILGTLSDDDFFNVMSFSTDVRYVEDCFNGTLVQANMDNKRRIQDKLDHVETRNIADYSKAFAEAFLLLDAVGDSDGSTQCNKAIMLITDGADGNHKEIFDMYNRKKEVRVFTYLIGRDASEYKEVRWMACYNRGYFCDIATLADVQENVQEYVKVLSRPMVLNGMHPKIWTGVYHDKANYHMDLLGEYLDVQHLRMMTSVAQPVFDLKNGTIAEGNLLGVVGTDVPLDELRKRTPQFMLGPSAYSFAITNNGYVLFHPDLRPIYRGYINPNYNSIDLSEVELEAQYNPLSFEGDFAGPNFDFALRKAMIHRETGNISVNVLQHYDDMSRVVIRNNTYFYTAIKGTPFSLGIALPSEYGLHHLENYLTLNDVSESLINYLFYGANENLWRVPTSWTYCRRQIDHDAIANDSKEEELLYLLDMALNITLMGKYEEECEQWFGNMIGSLLHDAYVTRDLVKRWKDIVAHEAAEGDIEQIFLGTRAGLTRFYNSNSFFQDNHHETIEEMYYKRAVDFGPDKLVLSVPFVDELYSNFTPLFSEQRIVTASSPVVVSVQEKSTTTAVVGMNFNMEFFAQLFYRNTKTNSQELSCNPDDANHLLCYILDDSGFVVLATDFDDVGKFFGRVDYKLMQSLIDKGLYKPVRIFDYQGMCEIPIIVESSASSHLRNPFPLLLNWILWFWTEMALYFAERVFYIWGDITSHVTASMPEYEKYQPCHRQLTLYKIDWDELSALGGISGGSYTGLDCINYKKYHSAVHVPDTNLLLVTVDNRLSCSGNDTGYFPQLTLDGTEVEYVNECMKLRRNVYRKRPSSLCFSHHSQEKSYKCGKASSLTTLSLLLLGALLCLTTSVSL